MSRPKNGAMPAARSSLRTQITAIANQNDGAADNALRIKNLQALAQRHSTYGTSRSAPVREILSLTGDKWTALILGILQTGRCRSSALQQLVSVLSHERAISHRVLTAKLRRMERDGLIVRRIWPSVPPRVEYQLSILGQSLMEKIEALLHWAEDNYDAILSARTTFDGAAAEDITAKSLTAPSVASRNHKK